VLDPRWLKRLAAVALLAPAVALLLLWIVAAFNLARVQTEAHALQRFYERRDSPGEVQRLVSRHDANWRNLFIGICSPQSCVDSVRISAYPEGVARFLYTHKLGWSAPSFWWFSQGILIKDSKLIDAEQGLTAANGRYTLRVVDKTKGEDQQLCIPRVAKLRRYLWDDNFVRWGFASLGVRTSVTSTTAGAFDFRKWCLLARCFDPRKIHPLAFEGWQREEAREQRSTPAYEQWPSAVARDAEMYASEADELAHAEKGEASAQWARGMTLIERGQEREGMLWLRKAAAQRHNSALVWLGLFYMRGQHVRQDRGETFRLFELAARQGSTTAMTNLAFLYLNGWGTPKSVQSAIHYYEQAAARSVEDDHHILGSTRAMSNLCQMDLDGERAGTPPDVTLRLCEESARYGDRNAQYRLAQLYENGRLVPKDLEKAFGWYRAAALLGNLEAADRLADFYRNGVVADQNNFQAYFWSRVADHSAPVASAGLDAAEIRAAESCIKGQHETNERWNEM
jgi:TPR repeat protein